MAQASPSEPQMEIVRHMDMHSIWRLREVSIATRDLVHSSHEYRVVREESELVDAFRASKLGKKGMLTMFAD